jgi:hypothetical protein
MPLHMAIGMFYAILSEGRDYYQQLELDAVLGDEDSQVELNREHLALVQQTGGEVA